MERLEMPFWQQQPEAWHLPVRSIPWPVGKSAGGSPWDKQRANAPSFSMNRRSI